MAKIVKLEKKACQEWDCSMKKAQEMSDRIIAQFKAETGDIEDLRTLLYALMVNMKVVMGLLEDFGGYSKEMEKKVMGYLTEK